MIRRPMTLVFCLALTLPAGRAMAQQAPATAAPAEKSQAPQPAASPASPRDADAFFTQVAVSAFLDAYLGYDANRPSTQQAQFRSYDGRHNSLSLSMAELALEKKPTADSRAGFRVDLDYGSTPQIVHASEPGGTTTFQNIGQAYVSFLVPAGSGLQIDIGKFYTAIGNEVVKAKDDWNYSRSLLFTLAEPTYHMGVRVAYTVNDRVLLSAHLVNGWNDVVDNNTGKTVGAQLTLKPIPALTISEMYMGGPEQANDSADWRHLSDTVVSYAAAPKVSVAMNYDYGRDMINGAVVSWQGAAGYVRLQPVAWFAFSPRIEHYSDPNGVTSGTSQALDELTLTAEMTHKDGVVLRLEYRHDWSDHQVFLKGADSHVGHQDTFTVGLLYALSSKQ